MSLDLHAQVEHELRDVYDGMSARGELLSHERLRELYERFGERFGPAVLRRLSGERLLTTMKGFGRDELIYWLEFKDDDEFPAVFGSIAGGSALKYGIYKRNETGAWTRGSSAAQREVSIDEAMVTATEHRDQLLRACDAVAALPQEPSAGDYVLLQRELVRVAPDVQDSSWGHKYLSLVFPDKLDDFHVISYQRHHLLRVLQEPSGEEGRYVNAFGFRAIQRHFGWPMNHLTSVMNRRNGPPRRYWRIGTRAGDSGVSYWEAMQANGVVSIGWPKLGDLSAALAENDLRESVRAGLERHYPGDPRATGRRAQQITHFVKTIKEGDYVLASDGAQVLGIGRVAGPYAFLNGEAFPHAHPVEWLVSDVGALPEIEGLRTTVHECRKHPRNLVAIERIVLERASAGSASVLLAKPVLTAEPSIRGPRRWSGGGTIGRIQDVLARKGQVILHGPPGTGKTHWAESAARQLAALTAFGVPFEELDETQRRVVYSTDDGSLVRVCSFHPGYGYEDFIEGYRPQLQAGTVGFSLKDGVFKRLCARAASDPEHHYYLLIDEINRGDIPRIFGELLTLLELTKRGMPIVLPLSGDSFTVPKNVYVIGTMNTADRSIALLDAALRRRFGFIHLPPDPDLLGTTAIGGVPLGPWLAALNRQIVQQLGRDGRNLQVGHSYFMVAGHPIQEPGQLARVLQEDILPLLEEHCYDDWPTFQRLLPSLVNASERSIRYELFAPSRVDDLMRAMLTPFPEVTQSIPAVVAEEQATSSELEEESDDETESA